MVTPLEFVIPRAATSDGELDLTWDRFTGRGIQVAKVWVIKCSRKDSPRSAKAIEGCPMTEPSAALVMLIAILGWVAVDHPGRRHASLRCQEPVGRAFD